ncbi:MAG: amidase [Pseudomonadota bacterium]
MGGFPEYDRYDGLGLAELIRKGEVKPAEVCDEARNRIENIDPKINSVVVKMFEEARGMSEDNRSSGLFAGVPFLIKDLGYSFAGYPLSNGCKSLKNNIPDRDCEMVARYKKAGLVTLGKTNTPEFGLLAVTEPDLFGPCRNPWNLDHTPGGSSGGSAAAVAAGLVPLAAGGDGGGSIRIPAAYCGLFGLKPSRGRNPLGPFHGQVWQGAVQEHVITRTVRDSAAALDLTQGPDIGAPYEIRPPERPYLEEAGRDPGVLRIAFTTRSPLGNQVQAECARAVTDTALLLESLGHQVEEAQPEVDGEKLARGYLAMYFGEVAAEIDELERVLGRKAGPGDVETLSYTLGMLGRAHSASYLVLALREWDLAARQMGVFFTRHDLYLTPTTAALPARIGELQPKSSELKQLKIANNLRLGWVLKLTGLVEKEARKNLERTPFTQLANLTGLPAMSVPLHWSSEGLPCGSQFIAPFGEEARLFRLAGQLEKARPWFNRRPTL